MDFKEKILTQAIVCCMIFVVAKAVAFLPGENIDRLCSAARAELTRHYTVDEVRSAASELLEEAKEKSVEVVHTLRGDDFVVE